MFKIFFTFVAISSALTVVSGESNRLVWPPPPDQGRVEYVGSINCEDISVRGGFFKSVARFLGGKNSSEQVSLPFDLIVTGETLYMTCQNIQALIALDRKDAKCHFIKCKEQPLVYPISLCDAGDGIIFMTDSEAKAVYKYENGELKPFISSGLIRPTGIAVLPKEKRLYVVDTGDHSLKIFDFEGKPVTSVRKDESGSEHLSYPTFATATADNEILVNDALNFKIRRYDMDGNLIGSFGAEGGGPGTFSRPKGIATDSEAHIYVVDNLFDNVQIFDATGQILLALGDRGNKPGQFWSPAGIDIFNDTLFIADTFNNRIQIMHYLREKP